MYKWFYGFQLKKTGALESKRLVYILAYTSQVNSVFLRSDWFLHLGISCTIHPLAKQDGVPFCFCYGRRFFNKRSRPAKRFQKRKENWQQITQRYVFLLLFRDKCTQDVFKMFRLRMMTRGGQADVP